MDHNINITVHVHLTSRMSNLAVLTLLQVFLSRDTGLMFIPAVDISKCQQ